MAILKTPNFVQNWPFLNIFAPQAKGMAFTAKVLEKIIFLTSK